MSEISGVEADIPHFLPSNKTPLLAMNISSKVSRRAIISNVLKLQSREYFRMKRKRFMVLKCFGFGKKKKNEPFNYACLS